MPLFASEFVLQTVLIPFLVFALAAIGLNILTGYTGLISLGTAGFMGVGAVACYKLTSAFPGVNIIVWILASGVFSALVGVFFGLPSLRIKGFLPRGRDARLAVLPAVVLHPHPMALQLQPVRRDRGLDPYAVRRPDHGPHRRNPGALPRGAHHCGVPDLDRLEPRPWPDRAACGWRCATWISRPN
jgi:hypothetical protein